MALDYRIEYAGRRVSGLQPGDSIAGGTCDVEAGSIGTLEFELPPTHPMARPGAFAVEDPTREVRLLDGETELFRGWVTKTTLDTDLTLRVECESMLAYLKRTVVRPYSCRQATDLPDGTVVVNQDPFEWLVAQHNLHADASMQFEVGYNPHVGEVRAATDYKTTWDELNDAFCTGLDRYLNVRSGPYGQRYLDLLDGGAGEGTQYVVLGENVVDMEVSGESGEVVTCIIPKGTADDSAAQADGDRISNHSFGLETVADNEIPLDNSLLVVDGDRAYNQQLVDAYGIREEKRDYEASNTADLLRMVAADLNPTGISEGGLVNAVTVQAIDLHAMNPDVQPMRLLEWTRVFVRAYGLEDDGAAYGVETGGRLIVDQWLPCSQVHVDLADPAQSTYRFGDLPQTLTRQSALRMGMLRRGDGSLVRRTDGNPWNNDRIWNHADEVGDEAEARDEEIRGEIGDLEDRWAEHLDEQFDTYTQQWYLSLDEAQKENAQGREELLKHLDEVEGTWTDELGRVETDLGGEISDLRGQVDTNHRTLLDGIRDVAQGAQRTFYGTGSGSGSSRTVSDLTQPGGESFTLAKGAVVDVKMAYACNGSCSLNVMGTGSRSVQTNGFSVGVWQAGQVVRFVYDGSYWQACSTDIYGSSITVGNPAQANFYTNGTSAQLRIGTEAYWKASMTGQTIGLTSENHVDIGSNYIDLATGTNGGFRISKASSNTSAILEPLGRGGVLIRTSSSGTAASPELGLYTGGSAVLDGQTVELGSSGTLLKFHASNLSLNNSAIVAGSFSATNSSEHAYVNISARTLGLSSAAGYAWAASNGDLSATNVAVTGASYNPSTRGITVHYASAVSGALRINLLGIPVSTVTTSDQPLPGPEMFGDESTENPDEEAV